MKAREVKAEVIAAADAATLQTAINTFLGALTEEQFVSLTFAASDGDLAVVILYTE